jgi:hypothetical protein
MAFKSRPPRPAAPDSPEQILLDLPRRKILGVLLHQGEVLRNYRASAADEPDVALQLPTGSGKTLVGLLVAEWRRRKFEERVVYLCPTRQLVNQVVEQADSQYGLAVTGFTGAASKYAASAKAEYLSAETIAVTTYSSLFNSRPFFSDPSAIVVDDAHAAENYIAEPWTVRVDRIEYPALHAAIIGVLRPEIELTDYTKISGEWSSPGDTTWVNKLPAPVLAQLRDDLTAIFDAHVEDTQLFHPWSMIRDHLLACHLYMGFREILIRPLIPPTWVHAPFAGAKQRVYMSATLGEGGDLERLTGRKKIKRLAVPQGWDKQGIGRRFFIFPSLSLDDNQSQKFRHEMMKTAGRSLVLVPSDKAEQKVADDVKAAIGYTVFTAKDIETSKQQFTNSLKGVAVVANRYDGIDFPGDDCRLLFVEGLPRATNLQESFIMSRMGANILYNDRVLTRLVQAVGRCTRSLTDYSAVVASGEKLLDDLIDPRKRSFMHPELQAELKFGIDQSSKTTHADLLDNFKVFLDHKKEWEHANEDIVRERNSVTQKPLPAMADLASVVSLEIEYQGCLWTRDYEGAMEAAESVLGKLTDSALRGYRALWAYLAGSAAWLGGQAGTSALYPKSRAHFLQAYGAASFIPWLIGLTRLVPDLPGDVEIDEPLFKQIERMEAELSRLGTVHDRAFAKQEAEILAGLLSAERTQKDVRAFETAQVTLGKLLGFEAGKIETDASPDPWWMVDQSLCFVFEAHSGALPSSALDATKARQAISHPNWIRKNLPINQNATVLPILVSPTTSATEGAIPHLDQLYYWSLDDFRAWAKTALEVIRKLRRTFVEPGDPEWRTEAADAYRANRIGGRVLMAWLENRPASKYLALSPLEDSKG